MQLKVLQQFIQRCSNIQLAYSSCDQNSRMGVFMREVLFLIPNSIIQITKRSLIIDRRCSHGKY